MTNKHGKMAENDKGVIISDGDWVMDDGVMRKVSHIVMTTVYMTDGGVMGLNEIDRVYLPGEIKGYN